MLSKKHHSLTIPDILNKLIPSDFTDVVLIKDLMKNGKLSTLLFKKQFKQKTRGIYCFWLVQPLPGKLNYKTTYRAPKGSTPSYNVAYWTEYKPDWLFQCLYVGRTSNFKNRISMHLMLDTKNWYENKSTPVKPRERWEKNRNQILKRNSQCQFRAGFEHLLKVSGDKNTIEQMIKSVGITFINDKNFSERFYLEDLAIGYLKPWFNLDSER